VKAFAPSKAPPLACPTCGTVLHANAGRAVTASRFNDCLRKCHVCGVGFSNAKTNPTRIYRDPELNVPEQVRDGVRETLRLALNEQHRPDKLVKFGFSTSEDALTWTVFRCLSDTNQLRMLFGQFGLAPEPGLSPRLLLWGVPIPIDCADGQTLRRALIAICDRLGELKTCRSEPDVIVDGGNAGLVVIEVKYRSGNEVKPFGRHYDRYVNGTDAFDDLSAIARSELYELTRNWRIGVELASGRPFTLVNLVVKNREPVRTEAFAAGINQKRGTFDVIRWSEPVSGFAMPEWLTSYLAARL
jgi:hypothetical protein